MHKWLSGQALVLNTFFAWIIKEWVILESLRWFVVIHTWRPKEQCLPSCSVRPFPCFGIGGSQNSSYSRCFWMLLDLLLWVTMFWDSRWHFDKIELSAKCTLKCNLDNVYELGKCLIVSFPSTCHFLYNHNMLVVLLLLYHSWRAAVHIAYMALTHSFLTSTTGGRVLPYDALLRVRLKKV